MINYKENNNNTDNNNKNNTNNAIDIGCDIMMINKENDNDIILVQCKNYFDKNVCIKDLAGFTFLLAFSHIPLKGIIISNTDLSERIKFKLKYIERIKYIRLDYVTDHIEQNINDKIIIPRDYQLEVVNKFNNIQKGIIQLPCGMGKTLIATLIAKNFNNIIILSPLRTYATQLFEIFNSHFINHECNLISMDGNRDINDLKSNLKDKNIFSSSFCSTDIVIKLLPSLNNVLLIVDEFHNLSLNNLTNTNDNIYKILTYNIDKKIFLSATPKIYKKINEDEYDELETYNFENIFGKIEYSYSFTNAINNKYINDYRFIIPNIEEEKDLNDFIYSNMLYYGYKKCIVYCKSIDECEVIKTKIEEINKAKYNLDIYLNKITYNVLMRKRRTIINKFKQEKYKLSIILSVHTLDECIDIPECDSVYFTYDVKNPINIIQRMCRSMRIYENKIKSGIFVWCENYKNIKNIKDAIFKYDNNLLLKLRLKTNDINLKNRIIKQYFIEKNNDIQKIQIDYNNDRFTNLRKFILNKKIIPEEFINNFFWQYKLNASKNDMIINFDNLAKWLNMRKRNFKKTLERTYTKDIDYKISIIKSVGKGRPTEEIMITPDCMKRICMLSASVKSEEVRTYFIKIEELVNEYNNYIYDTLKNE